ncbi:MAG TPA: hypothetical protein VG603_04485 [Chitinophagales bacterium]|nr:hypothetical protein [Chitinophagales bacterium]
MSYQNIREEELKNKIAKDYFWLYDCSRIIGNVDFCVSMIQSDKSLFEQESLLWAEAKNGIADIDKSIAQLILTIGKARTFDKHLPPPYLGAFDTEKIAFIPYSDIHDIFYQNDFNWNVAPSNYDTKEFKLVHGRVKKTLDEKALVFHYGRDDKELKRFIKTNFVVGKFGTTKIKIDKNNFMVIYNKWLSVVKPTIAVNWEAAKKSGIIDGDFYLADLLSSNNETLKEKLFVLLKANHYELDRRIDDAGMFGHREADFKDGQKAHIQFWNKYERPPKEEYWDYIVDRRDLLVPQDVRERKGSYYTPQKWVELSQKYLTDVLGENWQDEYYVWDCAAGTGNLLNGLVNKYNIWASTLDRQDVDVMKDRIKNGANLLEDHVFQFDFLNDDFDKLPKPLKAIIDNEEKRKKLVIYINPPYAEAASKDTIIGIGENKTDVAVTTKTYQRYQSSIGIAGRELFAQFFTRVYKEIMGCKLAEFSKLKILQAPNFSDFRKFFRAKLEKIFVVPADTFDNVKGQFPIGFFLWDTDKQEEFLDVTADVYNDEGIFIKKKGFSSYVGAKSINDWLISTRSRTGAKNIGFISCKGNDFQNTSLIFIINDKAQLPHPRGSWITDRNLIEVSIYYSARHCVEATWLNDRDQFLYPNDGWQTDTEFQNDCLAYTLFNNNIQSSYGANHWIPFTEKEVNARDKFGSSFMTDFIKGKLKQQESTQLFATTHNTGALEFSAEAKAVFDAGRELWKYYHSKPGVNVNASLYDIREYFQGRNDKGKMNNKSTDEHYMKLITALRDRLKALAQKIETKVYNYGFLKS